MPKRKEKMSVMNGAAGRGERERETVGEGRVVVVKNFGGGDLYSILSHSRYCGCCRRCPCCCCCCCCCCCRCCCFRDILYGLARGDTHAWHETTLRNVTTPPEPKHHTKIIAPKWKSLLTATDPSSVQTKPHENKNVPLVSFRKNRAVAATDPVGEIRSAHPARGLSSAAAAPAP